MDAEELMADYASECGWNTQTQLLLALRYIDNLKDNETFEDFLSLQKDVELREDSED